MSNKRHRAVAAGAGEPNTVTAVLEPSAESNGQIDPSDIARRAYSYWVARGRLGGSPEEDWFRAEKEIREEHHQPVMDL
jgi:hypothetical protein